MQHCHKDGRWTYTKDLKLVDEDISNVVILDDTPHAYKNFQGIFYNIHILYLVLRFYFFANIWNQSDHNSTKMSGS